MNRPRRIPSCLLLALGFAVLVIALPSSAQEIDNRPVYYLMLKSLEDGFKTYNEALARDLESNVSRLRAEYESRRRQIAAELEALEERRRRRETTFKNERDALNARIDAINDQIALRDGRISEERRIEARHSNRYADDPQVKRLKDRVAEQLAEIEAVRATYESRLAATRKARATLSRQFEEYMSAGDPLALEIRALEQDWQRFAEEERRKLKQLADAYAVDYAAYNEWLEGERAALETSGAAVASLVEKDRELRTRHSEIERELRGLIDEYNTLVEVHNAAGADDPGRDERAVRFAALDGRITELQAGLADIRDEVVTVNKAFEARNRDYTTRYQQFSAERREREAALAADLAEIDATSLKVEADIDARRRKVDAQIRTLEAHISDELESARGNLETLTARLVEDFGHDHEGFDVAIDQVLEQNDDALLYTAAGAPRFDLSRPLTASVYKAVERVISDRRSIDARIVALGGGNDGATHKTTNAQPSNAGALEQKRAELSGERQQLLEAHATFAREHQAQAAALEERRQMNDRRFADERALLTELYSARASVTRSELQALQRVLVAAAKGIPGPTSNGDDHARLVGELRAAWRRVDLPVNETIQAPHALLDYVASVAPESGSASASWQPFASRAVTSSRVLVGEDKAALASAWLARFRRQPRFAAIADELDASGAVMSGADALASLFLVGVVNHTTITEQRLDDGTLGIQVDILGRAYQLDPNGSLERLPSG